MSLVSDLWTSCCKAIYPDRCALCAAIGEPVVCSACSGGMVPVLNEYDGVTGEPYKSVRAGFIYEGRVSQAVKLLKYSRTTALADWMSEHVFRVAEPMLDEVDWVVPVPIHWTREAERGFNQAELLCRLFPSELVRSRVLIRSRATLTQVGMSIDQRLKNLTGAFTVIGDVAGKRVLIIDDVLTSGQTARCCAEELVKAGACEVHVAVFATSIDPSV